MSDFVKGLKDFLKNQTKLQLTEHSIVALSVLYVCKRIYETGLKKSLTRGLLALPLTQTILNNTLEKESEKTLNEFLEAHDCKEVERIFELPTEGFSEKVILEILGKLRKGDVQPSNGKTFALVYTLEEETHHKLITQCHNMFLETNCLNPMAFNSLRRMENDVVRMTASMLGGGKNARGTLTSGGTESLLLAVKTYRERAKALGITEEPEMILPNTAHPALFKAAHYFQVKAVVVMVNEKMEADVVETRKKINRNTILLVVSAPQYPHGIIDPVSDFAKLAIEFNLPLHVDSCIGGFVLPFAKKLGFDIPPFDLSVEGVTSISADVHKYGYSLKGASCLIFKNAELRKYQYFAHVDWPGGLFVSPSMPGTRGGGPIAAAWSALVHLGEKGYLDLTKTLLTTAAFMKKEIGKIDGLQVIGNPQSSLFSFKSTDPNVNIFSIADAMETMGWKIEAQRLPDSIHCTTFPIHIQTKEIFIENLKSSIEIVKKDPTRFNSQGKTGMYGMTQSIPDEVILNDFLIAYLGKLYQ